MSDEENVIRFSAQVFKIATLIDGGLRLTLDLSISITDGKTIIALLEAKQPGIILEVAAVPIIVEKEKNAGKHRKIHI